MEKKFTKGPWRVTTGVHAETTEMYDKGETWFNVNGEDGVIADVLHGRCLDADEEEAEANSKLIAAAPTMFELLEQLLNRPGLHENDKADIEELLTRITHV